MYTCIVLQVSIEVYIIGGVEWEATQWYRMTLLDGEMEMEAAKWPISSLC